ncbi:hypothetical protein Hanom_Chr02g00154111 [Helianthus anomalus]
MKPHSAGCRGVTGVIGRYSQKNPSFAPQYVRPNLMMCNILYKIGSGCECS